MNYLHLSLFQMHEALVNKKVKPSELALLAIKAAKKDDNNAFEYISEKEALEIAYLLDKEEPEVDNILWAIPFAIKDNFSTKDIPTCASSKLLEGYVPVFSSEVYQRLLNKKAIPIGKTTLDELAMGGTGSSGHKGKTFNPWDKSKTRTIGGSSCGSAACCAAGIVPFAIGSDTGDSVRKPAAYASLVGLKPTWGRISRHGLFPFSVSLDHVAYFTRNIQDSAYLLTVLAGYDEKDHTSSRLEVPNYLKSFDDTKKYRIAVIKEIIDEISDTCIKNSFNKSIDHLRKEGYKVEVVSLDYKILKAIYPIYYIISSAEATSNNANLDGVKFGAHQSADSYEEAMFRLRTDGFSDRIKRRFVIGSMSLLKENQHEIYLRALRSRRLIVNAFNEIFKSYDAIYVPTAPSVPPLLPLEVPSKSFDKEGCISDNYLAFANLGGYPSISIPLGFEEGLPFGGSLTCSHFEEPKLFAIAKKIEDGSGLKDLIAGDEHGI